MLYNSRAMVVMIVSLVSRVVVVMLVFWVTV